MFVSSITALQDAAITALVLTGLYIYVAIWAMGRAASKPAPKPERKDN